MAIEGALTPANGGPVDQRLFLFDPQKMTWRVASKAPTELSEWPFLIRTPLTAKWSSPPGPP